MPTVDAPQRRAPAGRTLSGLRAAGGFLLRLPGFVKLTLAVLWASLIWSLSSRDVPLPSDGSTFWELVSNMAHAPLFGLLGLFLAAFLLRGDASAWPRFHARTVALVLALVVAWGATDEWHQSRVPGRDASPLDIVTDFTGAALVLWIAAYLGRHGASERGLWVRLLAGVVLCVAAAGLALAS
jgi:VanZ family protein